MTCGWAPHSICHKGHAEDFRLYPEGNEMSSNSFKQREKDYHLHFQLGSNIITGFEGVWEQD